MPESEPLCISCNVACQYGPVKCPNNRRGCLVLHFGFSCPQCGERLFDKVVPE